MVRVPVRIGLLSALVGLAALPLTAAPALAQLDRINVGMMSPKPPDRDRHRDPNAWPAPIPGWTNGVRFIPGGGYGGTVVVVGGVPCYAPAYYGWYLSPYGGANELAMSMRAGAFGLGYAQGSAGSLYPQVYTPPARTSSAPDPAAEAPDRATPSRTAGDDEDGTYYLHRKPTPLQTDPSLAQAVDDIQAAFRTGDVSRLERHVVPTDTLVLQSQGRTRKELAASAYLQMTRDALRDIRTVRYALDRVAPASNGAWMVYGTHVLRGDDGAEKRFSVGFVLKKRDDRWVIAEVSADPAR